MTIKLDTKKLDNILEQAIQMDKLEVRVGVFDATNAKKAVLAEYGDLAHNVPIKSFLRVPLNNKKQEIVKTASNHMKKTLQSGQVPNAVKTLKTLGVAGESIALGMFSGSVWKQNAPSTIKRKGKDQPNVDTGAMRNAITSKIAKK